MGFVRRTWQYFLLALIIAGGAVLFWQRDNALDYLAMRGYTPSADIQQIVAETTMTPFAERLFYVNRPLLEEKDAFNTHCTDDTDQIATLGCYTGNRQGIFLYNVTDDRLSGVEQVTAAHEMLHQAYDRLGPGEKERVDGLLKAFNATLTDPVITGQMESYKELAPTELVNEMHSIFGTQVKDLPAELETYYKKYFVSRMQVIDFYTRYRTEFDLRRQQIKTYDDQLASIKTQIEVHKKSLEAKETMLDQRRVQLDQYLDNDQIVAYNATVPGFNALVNAYRAEVNETNALISQFNSILDARNAIAIQERELQQALDSHIEAASGQ
jgi:hypothetical protein